MNRINKALESLKVEEFIDGEDSAGAVNISNKITIDSAVEKIVVVITSEGANIYIDGELIYEP